MIRKITILLWILIFYKVFHCLALKPCELTLDSVCSDTEYCDEGTKQCQCLKGYERFNITLCILESETDEHTRHKHSSLVNDGDGGSMSAYILTPLILIAFVICGIYINRKYHLVTWVRNKMIRNNENYDEFMIGQDLDDDPPLH